MVGHGRGPDANAASVRHQTGERCRRDKGADATESSGKRGWDPACLHPKFSPVSHLLAPSTEAPGDRTRSLRGRKEPDQPGDTDLTLNFTLKPVVKMATALRTHSSIFTEKRDVVEKTI